jgi:hypothetical protein
LQIHRIARHVERNVIVAAERQRRGGIELAARDFRLERDLAGREHVG